MVSNTQVGGWKVELEDYFKSNEVDTRSDDGELSPKGLTSQ